MSTKLLKAILSQPPEIQLFIFLALITYSQYKSLEIQSKSKFKKHKLVVVSSQACEFTIVNIIGWIDPISGFWVGFCFFLLHLAKALIEEEKNNKR